MFDSMVKQPVTRYPAALLSEVSVPGTLLSWRLTAYIDAKQINIPCGDAIHTRII